MHIVSNSHCVSTHTHTHTHTHICIYIYIYIWHTTSHSMVMIHISHAQRKTVQSSAVITRSNIIWHCTHHCRKWSRISIRGWTPKRHPIPRPDGRAIWVSFVNILEKVDLTIMTQIVYDTWTTYTITWVQISTNIDQPILLEQNYGTHSGFVLYLYYAHVVIFRAAGIILQVGFGWSPGLMAATAVVSMSDRVQVKIQRSLWRQIQIQIQNSLLYQQLPSPGGWGYYDRVNLTTELNYKLNYTWQIQLCVRNVNADGGEPDAENIIHFKDTIKTANNPCKPIYTCPVCVTGKWYLDQLSKRYEYKHPVNGSLKIMPTLVTVTDNKAASK